jgi:hypothetical protein
MFFFLIPHKNLGLVDYSFNTVNILNTAHTKSRIQVINATKRNEEFFFLTRTPSGGAGAGQKKKKKFNKG